MWPTIRLLHPTVFVAIKSYFECKTKYYEKKELARLQLTQELQARDHKRHPESFYGVAQWRLSTNIFSVFFYFIS